MPFELFDPQLKYGENLTILVYGLNTQLYTRCAVKRSSDRELVRISDNGAGILQAGCCCFCYIHPFNGPFSGTTLVGRYQKGKTNLDFTEARDSEWQWHQLGHMQVCTSLQTDNHALSNLTENSKSSRRLKTDSTCKDKQMLYVGRRFW